MVKDVCRVYNLNPNYLRNQLAKKAFKGDELFYDDNIIAVTGRQPQREAIINSKEPCCIITSSGMLNGGPSQWYAEKLALDEGNFIAVTGYQDEEAPGRQLLELMDIPEGQERIFKFGERSILLKCGIGKYGLSAHADKTEIISIVHALAAKDVFFVHGNDETISSLAFEVQKEYRGRIHAPANGDQIDMIVRNPRKQIQRTLLSTLNKPGRLSENVLKEIWEFALKNYGTDRAFTLEEILFMWNGKGVVCVVKYKNGGRGVAELNTGSYIYGGMVRTIEKSYPFSVDMSMAYTLELEEVAKFFKGEEPSVSIEDTLEVMDLLDTAQRSLDSGKEVNLNGSY
jgi:hypothetical protein